MKATQEDCKYKWVFKNKEGDPIYLAMVVAKDYSWIESNDADEVFSTVVRCCLIRALLATKIIRRTYDQDIAWHFLVLTNKFQ